MRGKLTKTLVVLAVALVFTFSVSKVYAQTTGIDVISLAKNKVLSIMNISTAEANVDIENKRKQVETDTLNYVDGYIKGLDSEIKAYTQQQKQIAQDNLDKNYKDIKAELDAARQGLIDDAKLQIKQAVDKKYLEQQQILDSELNKKLTEKFK